MTPLIVQVQKLSPDAELPEYATDGSGCFDIKSYIEATVMWPQVFNTGLAFEVPEGHVMLVFSRSGHGFKNDVRLVNCVAVIDSDYRGELLIKLTSDTHTYPLAIHKGDKIAQGMIIPIPMVSFLEVKELSSTERGAGGFGSTDMFAPVITSPMQVGVGISTVDPAASEELQEFTGDRNPASVLPEINWGLSPGQLGAIDDNGTPH